MSFGTLDPAELQCCGRQMNPKSGYDFGTSVYLCLSCYWGVTAIEFLRSAHLPSVTKAVADKTLGRQF